jgi:hypothetical protein
MSSRVTRPISIPAVLFWLTVAALLVSIPQIDWSQDLGAYEDNIARRFLRNEQTNDDAKSIWYSLIVGNIFYISGDAQITIQIMKSVVIGIIFFSYHKLLKDNLDAVIVIAMIGFAPVVSDNVHEYLRQGMAIGVFLLAISYPQPLVRWPLFLLAYSMHQAVLFVGVSVLLGYAFHRLGFDKAGRAKSSAIMSVVGAVIVSALLALAGGALPILSFLNNLLGFLSGNRNNTLGAIYLIAYASYLGYRTLLHGTKMHSATLISMVIICSFYTTILDFGRSVSITMPLHIAAALSLERPRDRYLDLLAVFAATIPIAILSYF